jgi:hypothetical protein
VKDKRGAVYMGTMGLKREKFEGHLYKYDAPANNLRFMGMDDADKGEFSLLGTPPSRDFSRIDDLGAIAPQEGVLAMCYDPEYDRIYGITTEGDFYIYDIAGQKKTLKPIFAEYIVKKNNIPRAMLYDDGIVYFSGLHGQIIAYDPGNDAFRMTSMKIPVGHGREYLNYATCLIKSPDNFIYGGTFADGFLFRFDPENEKLYNLGKPGIESQICSLTSGNDGMIWGLSGGPDELTHLFRFDPKTNESKDLGMMRSRVPRIWTVHKAGVLITGSDGELFIGEGDAMSHLLVYHPPIEKK